MRKSLLTISAVCLLVIASCKKDINSDDDKQVNCQLTESNFTATGGDFGKVSYTYDDKGRVINAKYDDTSDQYTYSSGQITLKTSDGITTTYKLGSTGQITSETYSDTPGKIEYAYNTEGYLVQATETNGTNISITKYTYSNGNLTGVDYGTDKLVISYTADSTPANFITGDDTDLPQFSTGILKGYFGKVSKNLVSKTVYNTIYTETYTYEKDSKGNVTKVNAVASDAKGFTISNKYDCK